MRFGFGSKKLDVKEAPLYTLAFLTAYIAQTLLLLGQALTFRLSDVVRELGGTSVTLGVLVASGLAVATLCRFLLVPVISRIPLKISWLSFVAVYLLGNIPFLLETEISVWIYVGRAAFVTGYAGMMMCAYTFIQRYASEDRRAEAVAMLGQSTFLGLIVGAFLGDFLVERLSLSVGIIFWAIAGIGIIYGLAVLSLPKTSLRATSEGEDEQTSSWPIRYFLSSITLGAQIAFVSFFLLEFLRAHGIASMGPFFLVYCISAFAFRGMSRQWIGKIGSKKSSLIGLTSLIVGQLSFLLVTESFHLALPAIFCAAGRAYIEPCAIVEISRARGGKGSGTALALATLDTGIMFAALAFGFLNDIASIAPVLFCVGLTGVATLVMLSPARSSRRVREFEKTNPSTAQAHRKKSFTQLKLKT